jgi:hypothetical protein
MIEDVTEDAESPACCVLQRKQKMVDGTEAIGCYHQDREL